MDDRPIPAATLVLVRNRLSGPPELLMVERAAGMAFAGGALVFPGGRIDDEDRELAAKLGLGEDGAAKVAAIRETIEETAIPVGLSAIPHAEQCLELQAALAAGSGFADLLNQSSLKLDPAALTPFARWVPKFHAARRFDTLFFIAAAAAPDREPAALAGECTGAFWISAQDALERDRRGDAKLIFPTRRNLERLARNHSFEDILADANAHRIEPITPWVEDVAGEKFVTIPAGLGYPVVRERLDGLWRG